MLTTLCIKNFAIVHQLELDFTKGMTAFTGETGAGKSIMIDALLLALGGRAEASVVRPGEALCDITASFTYDNNSETANWLAQHELATEEGNTLYLRRIIYAEGRSKAYINAHPFPLQKIKDLSESLVHLHGQHQHQTLMQHPTHRQQLDQYAQHHDLLNEVAHLYKQHNQIKQTINKVSDQSQQVDKVQLLQFQLNELSNLNLQAGELQSLHQEHQILNHAKDYLEHSQTIQSLLSSEDKDDMCSILNHILQVIAQLPQTHPQIKNAQELINSALIHCGEAIDEIKQFAGEVQLDPERLHDIEERMTAIHALGRKYHIDSNLLPQLTAQLKKQLQDIQDSQKVLDTLKQELKEVQSAYHKAALSLRSSRQLYAKRLAEDITRYIHQLGMPKGWVEIELTPLEKMHPHGLDKVEYKVCTNPGMEVDSLNKIASGGELSRIGLAIQMITAKRGSTPTLLFDEVDVGIGGATAALVGKMLRQLGERLQVFCVTHQPQVAAFAHNHYQVEKNSDAKQTTTHIHLLNVDNKISEIARMLGGLNITEQSLSHARELVEESNSRLTEASD
ncbi:MAG: DNA repair protein RecN [Legionella sp.]|nr:DNA repair protein RecN [Legionella sp.]